MADIPGLIKGAGKGKGLGHKFLKHIERNKILLMLIDGNDTDPISTFGSLKNELKTYNKNMLLKPIYLIRTKGDILEKIDYSKWESIPEYLMEISSVTKKGLTDLVKEISKRLDSL